MGQALCVGIIATTKLSPDTLWLVSSLIMGLIDSIHFAVHAGATKTRRSLWPDSVSEILTLVTVSHMLLVHALETLEALVLSKGSSHVKGLVKEWSHEVLLV